MSAIQDKPAGGPGSQPVISVAMIVKNEEVMLPRALASVRPWVDEIVVVDTGSTDRTMDIAREFGAKVHIHPWENDFSKHRNQSVSYCTGDWILILDADEELDQASGPEIRRAASLAPADVYCLNFTLFNLMPDGSTDQLPHPRLFRNHAGFHYEGSVHNKPVYKGTGLLAPVKLYHHGYNLDPAIMQAKDERRRGMVADWVEKDPEDWRARYHWAQTLVFKPETAAEAVREARTSLDLARRQGEAVKNLSMIYLVLLQGLSQDSSRDQESLARAAEWRELVPGLPDPVLFAARAHYRLKQFPEAAREAEYFVRLVEFAPRNKDLINHAINTAGLVYSALALWTVSEAALGRQEKAREVFHSIQGLDDAESVARLAVDEAEKHGLMGQALDLAGQAAREKPEWKWPRNYLARLERLAAADPARQAREKAGEMTRHAKELTAAGRLPEAAQVLRDALKLHGGDPLAWCELGFVAANLGQGDEAEKSYMRALELDAGLVGAWFNLALVRLQTGRPQEGKAALLHCLKLDPTFEPAAQVLAQLTEGSH